MNPVFTDTVEVHLAELLRLGDWHEPANLGELLVDRIDEWINAEAYEALDERPEDIDTDDLDELIICPPDEINIQSYAMTAVARPNVAEFTVSWVRDFVAPTLEVVV